MKLTKTKTNSRISWVIMSSRCVDNTLNLT